MKSRYIVAAGFSGGLLALAFPNFDLGWLAWIALAPLFWAIEGKTPKQAFFLGWLSGIIFYLSTIYWIAYTLTIYGRLPWGLAVPILLLLVFYLGLYFALFTAAAVFIKVRFPRCWPVLAAVLWVALEYLRTYLFTGFPWVLLGYSQYRSLPVIQIADITGVYGVSALALLVNATLGSLLVFWQDKTRRNFHGDRAYLVPVGLTAGCLILICLNFVYGYSQMRIFSNNLTETAASSEKIKVAVMQGNISQEHKWDPAFQEQTLAVYRKLSLQSQGSRPQLMVWPESAIPFFFQIDRQYRPLMERLVDETNTPLLFGSPSFTLEQGARRLYNSAYLLTPQKHITGVYHKLHLVPFGEYVPLRAILGSLGTLVAQVGDFSTGDGYTLFTLPMDNGSSAKFATVICFEVIFPELTRRFFARGAQFLITITNDAWFGRTSAPLQHFSAAVFRAVENKTYVIRAANTGISGFIGPQGRIISRTELFVPATLTEEIALTKGKTFYARHGDLFAQLACIVSVLALSLGWVRR